jgi:multidrug efflux pump subunit AcrB
VTGPIAWMAKNGVAANLLMLIVFAVGCLGLFSVTQETFPDFDLDVIQVQVVYPGASPSDVEQGIVLAVEEAVRGLDGVKRVTSTSGEGVGTVAIELILGADDDRALTDIRNNVDRIVTFPEDAERPSVRLVKPQREVISMVIYGEQTPQTLHKIGEKARTQLLNKDGITQVDLFGVPALEIAIEIPQETLRAYGLSLQEVSRQISASSVELPGGGIKTQTGEILVRIQDRRREGHALHDIPIRTNQAGGRIRLGDIATINDGFAETDQAYIFDGKPAVRLTAYRIGDETPQSVADIVNDFRHELRGELPANIGIEVWDDSSQMLRDRIELLVRNGAMGLILVICVLALFLELRLALWVALGIPISFMGAFALMPGIGLSINMVTLFAFIITLGMVVDDAIVVGENAYEKRQKGMPPLQAAVEGAREMSVPVTFSILTTMAAFSPLLLVPGVMGKFFGLIPKVVIAVLLFSLVESFFVLPAHLAHTKKDPAWWMEGIMVPANLVRRPASRLLAWFIDSIYKPVLQFTLSFRYVAAGGAIGLFIIAAGLLASGIQPFSFFPKLEGNMVKATARLPYGANIDQTQAIAEQLLVSLDETIEQFGGDDVHRGVFVRVGEGAEAGFGGRPTGSHLVNVTIDLIPTEQREFSSLAFEHAWNEHTPELVGVEALVINSSSGPGSGAPVDVMLTHADTEVLARASAELTHNLRGYDALANIQNSYSAGKPQFDGHLREQALLVGLTGSDVARQIRSSFFGSEAIREQRDRNEIRYMVRLPEHQRQSEYDLEQLMVKTPAGGHVPVAYLADFERTKSPTTIVREEAQRIVNVTADLAAGTRSSRDVLEALTNDDLPTLRGKYPGLKAEFAGEQREQAETFAALATNYFIAMVVMFTLLAIPFKSYVQPVIVMSAIPFGFIGAVGGHMLLGYEMSIISMFGLVALSGVVVNDSLVLIDATNKRRMEGATALEAITYGGTRRLRPILLTSLTTFFGLAPMIMEQSMQARFLIPMAISLGFGVLFATGLILLLVPALYMILEDVRWLVGSPDPRSSEARAAHEAHLASEAAPDPAPAK